MRVLGIEGTAWAASAAVYDDDAGPAAEDVFIETDAYQPESGGIHPREAAEHMRGAIPGVVGRAMDEARERHEAETGTGTETGDGEGDGPPIDAVAFSRGPGLGPCLRIVATAARALAGTLGVPLVGVNHMVAHLEIGRHRSGFDAPICLNASGANAHLLGFRNGRYRVLGETMDTGVGNAIDKFTRHLGWSHPGGPKVEEAAKGGEYVELPYVVKGMDFSFSGITSAAKGAHDDGVPVGDVCFSLQETVFAMLTEVSERALSLTDADELVLGGGVGQNARLREMLHEMCEARGASFFAPEPRFLRDNAGMIAVLGAKMYAAGDTIEIEDSRVRPDFRPDEVPVTWREDAGPTRRHRTDDGSVRGAEALVEVGPGRVTKRRLPKSYRHPELDRRLRRERTRSEARLTSEARREGVPTPVVLDVDDVEATLVFETVGEADLRDALSENGVREVGRHLATLHRAGVVHGDPTPRNARVSPERTYLIDFGLGYYTDDREDFAMDLHVFEQSVVGTADDADDLVEAFEEAYREAGDPRVLDRLREIEGRGRYR
jgi:N6-L-threonylcarbamoyladenine synthase/protein kinase Bud32